jgi:hypothetical protein
MPHDTGPLIHPFSRSTRALVLTMSILSSMRSTLVGGNGERAGDVLRKLS